MMAIISSSIIHHFDIICPLMHVVYQPPPPTPKQNKRKKQKKKKRKKVLKYCLISLGKNVIPTSGNKIVETLYSENKRICTPPLSPPFKVGLLVVFYR